VHVCHLQLYPENAEQATLISEEAMKAGFSGGLVVDYPHSTRAKKFFLCLMVGSPSTVSMPPALQGPGSQVAVEARESSKDKKRKADQLKGKSWVIKKKTQRRVKGHTGVAPDSKYTARKRKDKF
jgi:18S rRNA (guanine1575-N7)-methyltransferase